MSFHLLDHILIAAGHFPRLVAGPTGGRLAPERRVEPDGGDDLTGHGRGIARLEAGGQVFDDATQWFKPLRTLEEIHADILALEKETAGLLGEIVGGGAP